MRKGDVKNFTNASFLAKEGGKKEKRGSARSQIRQKNQKKFGYFFLIFFAFFID